MAKQGKRKRSSFADLFSTDVEVLGRVTHCHRKSFRTQRVVEVNGLEKLGIGEQEDCEVCDCPAAV